MKCLLMLLMGLSIYPVYSQDLPQDELVQQYFTNDEIAQLEQLLNAFEAQIGKTNGEESLLQQYLYYFEIDTVATATPSATDSLLLRPVNANEILSALDSSLFNKMFNYNIATDPSRGGMRFRQIAPKSNSSYVKLGLAAGKTNDLWEHYFDALSSAGDLPPSAIATLPRAAPKYADLDRGRDRLFIAIHYLIRMAPELGI